MIYILIGLGLLLLVGIAGIVQINRKENPAPGHPSSEVSAECCGAHEVCESESLLTLHQEVVYYSDEELDHFKGVACAEYSLEQIEQFRDILLTLRTDEVAGWLKSLQLRGIFPPEIIREEALMIVRDLRELRDQSKHK